MQSATAVTEPTQNPSHLAPWLVVGAAFSGAMVSFGSLLVFTFGVFVKPLGAEFGWSRETISGAFGAAAMTVAIASPFLGRLLDRYGPRRIILPCMALFGAGIASLSLLRPNLWQLYAIFILLGAVGNGTSQMGYARAISTWFDRNRGLALSLVMAGVGVGAMIMPPLAQNLITHHGWRAAYLVLGVLVFVLGLPLTALFVRERPVPARAGQAGLPGFTVAGGLRSRAFWILVSTLFLGSITVNGAVTHLSPLLTDRGISAGHAALAVSILGGASFCGRLITGHLLDRYFGPRVSFVLMMGIAAGIAMLARLNSTGAALGAAALIGFGLGGEADITPYLLTRYFGLRSFSTLYGFTWTAYAMAGAIGPVLMGKAFDATGSYGPLLSTLSLVAVAAAALMLFLPRYPADYSRTA